MRQSLQVPSGAGVASVDAGITGADRPAGVGAERTAVTSLPELVDALRCNWGEHMVEPFVNQLEGPARIQARAAAPTLDALAGSQNTGNASKITVAPDPRFGMAAPLARRSNRRTPCAPRWCRDR